MFEILLHPTTTYTNLTISDDAALKLTKEYIQRKFLGRAEWIDNDGYLCWDDPYHRHGSIDTIRGEKATKEQHTAFNLLTLI